MSESSQWPTLEVREGKAVCPTCGEAVTGEEFDQPFRDKPNMVEMWPGGPVMDVPGICREVEPDGPPIWTLHPCGHRIGKKVVYSPPTETTLVDTGSMFVRVPKERP